MNDKCNVCGLPLVVDPRGRAANAEWYAEFQLTEKRGRPYSGPIWQEKRCRMHREFPSQEDSRARRVS